MTKKFSLEDWSTSPPCYPSSILETPCSLRCTLGSALTCGPSCYRRLSQIILLRAPYPPYGGKVCPHWFQSCLAGDFDQTSGRRGLKMGSPRTAVVPMGTIWKSGPDASRSPCACSQTESYQCFSTDGVDSPLFQILPRTYLNC